MKASVFSLEGKKLKEIVLPRAFDAEVDRGLIKRAVLSIQSMAKQPKGANPRAGRDNTAKYRGKRSLPMNQRGINVGRARLPRLRNRRGRLQGRVASVPQAVGGPKAHPPKALAVKQEKINRKEKRAGLAAAIAAAGKHELVSARHSIGKELLLPVVVENDFEQIEKTKRLNGVLAALNLGKDLAMAKGKTRRRSGKGKQRGRKKKQKKSILIVTGKSSPVFRAARNMPGVDVCAARNLNAELLAPGCLPGRLSVWTEAAISELLGKEAGKNEQPEKLGAKGKPKAATGKMDKRKKRKLGRRGSK